MKNYDFNIDGEVVELKTAEVPKDAPKTQKQKRARRFCLTSYVDPTELRNFLSRSPWAQHWAMCTHDRDIKDDGSVKETHTHIILYTYDAKTSSAIKKIFDRHSSDYYNGKGDAQNTLVQVCNDVVAQWHYLIHKYDKDKAQYSPNERICDNSAYWLELCKTNALSDSALNTGLQMFDDIVDGISTREMICRYGKEYIYHARAFKECVADSIRDGSAHDELEKANKERMVKLLCNEASVLGVDDESLRTFSVILDGVLQNLSVLDGYDFYYIKKG